MVVVFLGSLSHCCVVSDNLLARNLLPLMKAKTTLILNLDPSTQFRHVDFCTLLVELTTVIVQGDSEKNVQNLLSCSFVKCGLMFIIFAIHTEA